MFIKSIKITNFQSSAKILTVEIVIYCPFVIKNNKMNCKNIKIKNKKEDNKSTFWNVKFKTNMIKLK